MSETPSVPGWYITFQTDVLSQLPRPDAIDGDKAYGWHQNRMALRNHLHSLLCSPQWMGNAPEAEATPKVGALLEPVGEEWVQLPTRARWSDFAERPSEYYGLRLIGGLQIPGAESWVHGDANSVRVQASRVVRDCDPLDLVQELGGKFNAEFNWWALFGLLGTSHLSQLLKYAHGATHALFLRVGSQIEFAGLQRQGKGWVLDSTPLGYVGGGYVGSGTTVLNCTGTK